ncbi:SulP family inorganic anion transporter [Azoarcus sp. KH32C]|uniref:SulP family inorganic anion transporter n=1 Tax=Azoarcus sp. KH32C TaxID=748247 RepID=UPI0002387079|nr:SulP family inorganic anion transporter [Azoarcus sp. KH32C]BAL26669.1 MFS superfamily sulfate permease [Azoarcus sp. KH32C]
MKPLPPDWLFLFRLAPGVRMLRDYRREDFPHDLAAGLSVTAVAIPVSVAYAELAGFPPASGLYASMISMIVYAFFGSSRQLIVGPDAPTCAMLAAALAPIAAVGSPEYRAWSLALTFLVGLMCLVASRMRLGAFADFLSKPILIGFLNGIALSIVLGQLGKLLGFPVESRDIVDSLREVADKLPQVHFPTLAVGALAFATLGWTRRRLPRLPAALVVLVATGALTALLGLANYGVAVIGPVPAGLPQLALPHLSGTAVHTLFSAGAGITLVSFSSAMLTARSFAARNGYEIDPEREFAALGVANVASSMLGGFAVSGAGSRTAVSEASGGRTQMVSLVAAAGVALALVVLTGPLQYVPVAALGAVLVYTGIYLFDLTALRALWGLDRNEFWLALAVLVGVIVSGMIQAILVAVAIALVRFVRLTARPPVEVLGEVEGLPGVHATRHYVDARTVDGLTLLRFNAPLVFFNAPYFRQQVLGAAVPVGPGPRWLVLDLLPVSRIDVTGYYMLKEVRDALALRGIQLKFAGRTSEIATYLEGRGIDVGPIRDSTFPTLRAAIKAFRRLQRELQQGVDAGAA